MRARLAGCLLVLGLFFAGCSGKSPSESGPPMSVDFITPGQWNVDAETDQILVWVRNNRATEFSGTFSLAGRSASFLPDGWNVTFEPAGFVLKPKGTKVAAGTGRYDYPDWSWSLATIRVPHRTETWRADAEAVLLALHGTTPVQIHVDDPHRRVTKAGDNVRVQYVGRYQDDNTTFDDGEFERILGSGLTVPGFDNGLIGLYVGEEATLVIPAALAYGYDGQGDFGQRFNGRTLLFDVTITSIA